MTWPNDHEWEILNQKVEGRLKRCVSPIEELKEVGATETIGNIICQLKNPFTIEDQPWSSHSTGWHRAWKTAASPFVIEAETAQDIAEGVKFAKKHNIKLVIKSTGHDYLGRSVGADSLLIWTHKMRSVELHDAFKPQGGDCSFEAITIEAGTRWIEVFDFVVTQNGKYVQGGGCTTVGACGGFIQGGGFGSFSKRFGSGCASLLEAEVILANGELVVANAYQNADLFWALRGGGGGTFGVLSKITLKVHKLPPTLGSVFFEIQAPSEQHYQELVRAFMLFYKEKLHNPYWGEQAQFGPDQKLTISMSMQGLSLEESKQVWQPFVEWLSENGFTYKEGFTANPARHYWDYDYHKMKKSQNLTPNLSDPSSKFYWWSSNQGEILAYWYAYLSYWLPDHLIEENFDTFVETLIEASKIASFQIHFNKGLSGAPQEVLEIEKQTAINPIYRSSFGLLVAGAWEVEKFEGVKGFEPDTQKGEQEAQKITRAFSKIKALAPESGSLFTESDYFEKEWKRSCWGENYERLLEIKKKYDPDNLFKVHHGVGSDL